ncbi:hypothetical protein, partial [Chryseobacterium populi]
NKLNLIILICLKNREVYPDKCAYIEIYDLQFGFHNIIIDEKLQNFIESPDNNPKPWKGIRLQKVAGELFNYAINNTANY